MLSRARHLALCAAIAAIAAIPAIARAQQRQVRGIVSDDENGRPVVGAVVSVREERSTAQTNEAGRFQIDVSPSPVHLLVRALDYAPKEALVPAGDTTVTVLLHKDPLKLEAVVVTGQATGVQRRSSTTSTALVGDAELNTVPAATVDKALQGKIAGANIQTNSGAPGGGAQIQIRGINTVIGASDPLFVVDGVIYSNASIPSGLFTVTGSGSNNGRGPAQDDAVNRLADLNPDDIDNIQVLKSAAASSIYGSKAANGVVIITTKHGLGGKPHATISQRLGWSSLLRGPASRAFDTTQALALYTDPDAQSTIRALEVNGKLPFYDHLQEVAGGKPINYQTLLSVSGGNDNTKYYLSGEWKQDDGIIDNTSAGRQGLRANIDQRLTDRLQLTFTSAFARTLTDRGFTNNDNNGASITYAIAYIPSFVNMKAASGVFPELPFTYQASNPLQTIALGRNNEEALRYTGGGNLVFNALSTDRQTLKLVAGAGADFFTQQNTVFAPPELYFEQSLVNPGVATLGNASSKFLNWNLNAIHTYTPSGAPFTATTSFGAQYEDRRLDETRSTAEGLLPGQTHIDQGAIFGQPVEVETQERTFAMYGQEQLTALQERLLIEVGLRAERSSVFGNSDKFYVFPKLSASYRFPGLLGANSDLKIRGAYGETGNQPLFGQKYTTLLGGQNIVGATGIVNSGISGTSGIKPERVKEFEGGVDLSPFGGRVTLEVTAYKRKTTDLLLARTPAPSTGYNQLIQNGGQLGRTGVEASLGGTAYSTRNFSWLVHTTFTRTRSNVDNLPVPGFRPITAGFGLAYGEFFVQQGRPIGQIIGQTSQNPDGTFNVTYLGNSEPDFTWSLGNDFTYHALFASFLLDWQKGGVAQNQTLSLYDCNGLASDGGTPGGQLRTDDCLNLGIATPFVQSTAFLKLREVSIGVNVPRSLTRNWLGAGTDVKFIATGRNLFVRTNYFGYDPESSNFGQQAVTRNVDLGPYPPSRTFYFTLSAGF